VSSVVGSTIKEGIVMKAMSAGLLTLGAAAAVVLAACTTPGNEWTAQGGAWHLYKENCSGCHGFQGQGIKPAGTPLRGDPFVLNASAQTLKAVIREGRIGKSKRYPEYAAFKDGDDVGYMSMPPFEDVVINDRDLDLLVNYLKGGFQQGQFN
jgi:mono/diheme cytochrome c family protein